VVRRARGKLIDGCALNRESIAQGDSKLGYSFGGPILIQQTVGELDMKALTFAGL